MKLQNTAIVLAILAAALYALNIPISKLFLGNVSPTMMAAFLYLGAGLGLLVCSVFAKLLGKNIIKEPLTKKELPYTIAMILLDIAAPILLMFGVLHTNSANASLINNFEIVSTSLIALFVFKEALSKKLCAAIVLVTAASIILGFEGTGSLTFNTGSLFVLGACVCWGFENNCTKKISSKSSVEIVVIKGCFSGLGGLIIALLIGESLPYPEMIAGVLILGFVAYGLSINFYIMAQKHLGAAKTSAFYSISPFIGVIFSMILLGERPGIQFYAGLLIMLFATAIMISDTIRFQSKAQRLY